MSKTTQNASKKAKVDTSHLAARRKTGPVGTVVGLAESLAEVVRDSGALELRLDYQQHSLRIRRRRSAAPAPAAVPNSGLELAAEVEGTEGDDYMTPVSSQNVGIFRPLHPKTEKPLVNVGDTVEVNQCMGWVEAMGIRHDVNAPRAGTVFELLAEPGEPVEFGQFLFLIQ